MERREVERDLYAKIFGEPSRHLVDFLGAVVMPGNQQCRDLEPDVRLLLDEDERVENGLEMGERELVVEILGESLEIYVGRVHRGVEVSARGFRDVAGGHRDRVNPELAA